MQALRRRTQQAERQVRRRRARDNAASAYLKESENRRRDEMRRAIIRDNRKIDRQERWEQWFLGPVQSRGSRQALEETAHLAQRKEIPDQLKREARDEDLIARNKALLATEAARRKKIRLGNSRVIADVPNSSRDPLVKGARVVITSSAGHLEAHQGKIGRILSINRLHNVCAVEGVTRLKAPSDTGQWRGTLFEGRVESDRFELLPVHFSHLRPVRTIINEEGDKEDIILGKLSDEDLVAMGREEELDDLDPILEPTDAPVSGSQLTVVESEDQRTAREQASLNLTPEQIQERLPPPQPVKQSNDDMPQPTPQSLDKTDQTELDKLREREEADKKDPTTPSDNLRIEVDRETWTPTLLRAPLPGSVIDELRGKYSIFRKRHEPQYLEHLERVDAAREEHARWTKSGGGLLDTPARDASLRAQAEKKAALKRQGEVLDERILAGIGKLMWDKGVRLTQEQEKAAEERFNKEYGDRSRGIEDPFSTGLAAGKSGSTAQSTENTPSV